MNQKFQTKETANNPIAKINIPCPNCKQYFNMATALQERTVSVDYGAVTEGLFICPECGYEKHVYYMTEYLRNEQRLLEQCVKEWQKTQSTPAFRRLEAKKKSYQNSYDRVQEKYLKEFNNGSDQK